MQPEGVPDRSGHHQIAMVGFLFPEAPHEWLIIGAKFTVLEGRIELARGEIIQ